MDTGLAHKTAFITGASGGIGRALADAFAAEQAQLVLTGHSHLHRLQSYVADQAWADRALVVAADVADPGQLDQAMQAGVERFGRVDVCVANAGIWPPENLGLHELSVERVRRTVDVNLLGSVWTARAFLRQLAHAGPRDDGDGASLVFIGSTAGRFGERDHCDYSLSKAGLYGLVRTLKNEIARLDPYGRVNMVEPGWTATHMARPALDDPTQVTHAVRTMAVRQIGRAVDIARAVAFLASPVLARHVSGEILTVAGGMEGRLLWSQGDVDYPQVKARLSDA
jgi:3-oxoacyl-[acyl-carrier protein] reductase